MYQFFVPPEQIQARETYATITGADVHHIKDVARLKVGENIRVSTEGGKSYLCKIVELSDTFVQAEILSEAANTELPAEVVLFQALPKGDRMETIVEKTVELGVTKIVPVAMRYCVVRLDEKKAGKKRERWQLLAESAAKQSKRSRVAEIAPVVPFAEAIREFLRCDLRLVPYENARGMTGTKEVLSALEPQGRIGILIGPEGGFAPEELSEVEQDARLLSLGKRILRTDTAAITALSMIMLALEMKDEEEHGMLSG